MSRSAGDGPTALSCSEAVVDADAILVRSATTVDARCFEAGKNLKITPAPAWSDNVDVLAATARGA